MSNRKIRGIIIITTSIIMLAMVMEPANGFSTIGNFFETNDIICWLNFNDDHSDKSVNRYPATPSVLPVTHTSTICYDEKSVDFPSNLNQYFDFNSQAAIQRLNLNNGVEDCHVRISLWIDPDEDYGSTGATMGLVSKYIDHQHGSVSSGWELELEDINNGAGQLRFRIDNTVHQNKRYDMVTITPGFFNEEPNLFYGETFVIAGWDYSPVSHDGFIWLKAIIKSDPNTFTVYRNFKPIFNLPSSTDFAMRVGDHSRASPGKYVGLMDEFSITTGYTAGVFQEDLWGANIYSLPHENQIAYYNFENIENKNSITYDEQCNMFFDGAHVVPHNGKIVDENYQGASSSSWDNSDCLQLDGTNYGQIKKNIDGWGVSGGNFALSGWPKNNHIKECEVGCIFKMEGESENDQILQSKYGQFKYLGGTVDHGYKIGIDSSNKLFAALAINYSTIKIPINAYNVQLNTWYKCLLHIEKYVVGETYHIDVEVTIWEYSGGAWVQRGSTNYMYSHEKYVSGYPPMWRINDISDWWMGDAIIGGTWDSNINMVVIDGFEGKIDDAKWYKSLAFDLRGYNKYVENNQ